MDATVTVYHRDSVALSEVPSLESLGSNTSRRWAGYSHLLYCSPEKEESQLISTYEIDTYPISRFSSSSTSPNSSHESLDILSIPSQRHNRASSSITVPTWPTSNRTSRSTSSTYPRYADDHYPLITTVTDASTDTVLQMAHAYNAYIRALNSCYNHASVISDEQVPDFLLFNQTLFNILSRHLETEQQYILPLLHKPVQHPRASLRKAVLINDDHTFLGAFHAWANYIHDPATSNNFSSDYIRLQISTFAPILVQHLHDEVSGLGALVSDGVLIQKHLTRIWSKVADTVSANLDLYTDAVLLVGCHDKDFTINGHRADQEYPRLPIGTTTMVKKWHSRKYSGAWRFCSSDFSGKRRLISA
ncbi:hypothetical protein H2198_003576 [Neophaeococcomyces mojaviensis]|uniref:Uncharacterized protein n=1 Tax=Neophaeococcomyces mojaviensis TaxID=3383035 RepID=A0ACC3ABK1_9EURO|nr:hypothetical protein H2198_003576 [Knufia sp. JES_112]